MVASNELEVVKPQINGQDDLLVYQINQLRTMVDIPARDQRSNKALSRIARKQIVVPDADHTQPLRPFFGALEAPRYQRRQKFRDTSAFLLTISGVAFIFADIPAGIALTINGLWLAPFGILGVGFAAIAGSSPIMRRAGNDQKETERLAKERFARWLQKRHALNISVDGLASNVTQLVTQADRPLGVLFGVFKDAAGDSYKLVREGDVLHVERYVDESKGKKAKKQAKVLEGGVAAPVPAKPKVAFAGEAGLLFTQVRELLSKVDGRALGAEQQHAAKRIVQDLQTLVKFNEELHALAGPTEADQQNFITTLVSLRAEVFEILEQEQQLVSQGVAAQAEYVRQRRTQPFSPMLSLKKPDEV